MIPADEYIRQLIRSRLGDGLTEADLEALIPYVRRVQATSDRLAAFPLNELDPRSFSYIADRRLLP